MKSVLSIDRYKTLLEAYGARLERWPESEREAARALLEVSEQARGLSRAEAGLDALLSAAEVPELSAALSRRLAELPLKHPQAQKLWPFRRVWLPAVAWAAAAAFGIALGSIAPAAESEAAQTAVAPSETSASVASAGQVAGDAPDDDDEEDELLEMALGPGFELEETP